MKKKTKILSLFLILFTVAVSRVNAFEFSEPQYIASNQNPFSITKIDLNNDGLDDFASVAIGGSLNIYMSDGETLNLVQSLSAGVLSPVKVAALDVDLDGDEDIVILNSGTISESSLVLFENNDGVLVFGSAIALPQATPRTLAIEDIDSDGDKDFAIGSEDFPATRIVKNDNGVLTLGQLIPINATGVGFIDNGQGPISLAVLFSGIVKIYSSDSTGNFNTLNQSILVNRRAGGIHVTDLDQDGYDDMVVFSKEEVNNIEVVKNGLSGFTTTSILSLGLDPLVAQSLDFDSDGDEDVALLNLRGKDITLLENQNGALAFSSYLSLQNSQTRDFVSLDVDGDEFVDILATKSSSIPFGYLLLKQVSSNNAPVLTPIGNKLIPEGDNLQFNVSASDQDGDNIVITATNLPSGATFNGTTFTWNTTYSDAGNYENIEFTATDNGTPMELDVELITITVGDVNRAPTLTNPGPQEVLEEDSVSFSISATDPDGDTTTITATNLPSGATFNGTSFTWIPDLSDEGVYLVTFAATDTGTPTESASIDVVITVGDNPTPVEQAEDLIETVVTIDIPQNVENSYLANLQKVGQFIAEGKITAALNQLNAFKNKVQQDYQQGRLTQSQYQQLTSAANALIADLQG